VRDQISQPFITSGKIIVTYIFGKQTGIQKFQVSTMHYDS
jgi:hypothetical protein